MPMWLAPIVFGVSIALFYAMYANYQALPRPLMRENQVSPTYLATRTTFPPLLVLHCTSRSINPIDLLPRMLNDS